MYRKLAALARWPMPDRGLSTAERFTSPGGNYLFDVRLNESGELVVQPHASLIPLGAVIAAAPFAKRL
jgi:hypothetical protein